MVNMSDNLYGGLDLNRGDGVLASEVGGGIGKGGWCRGRARLNLGE